MTVPPALHFLLEWHTKNIKYINWVYLYMYIYTRECANTQKRRISSNVSVIQRQTLLPAKKLVLKTIVLINPTFVQNKDGQTCRDWGYSPIKPFFLYLMAYKWGEKKTKNNPQPLMTWFCLLLDWSGSGRQRYPKGGGARDPMGGDGGDFSTFIFPSVGETKCFCCHINNWYDLIGSHQ